jgi:3-oxoacyl-[acyl-carrier protein] reductase
MISLDLTGRKALVTGGSRGIGAGIIRSLALAGAHVTFTYFGSERGHQAAKRLVSELTEAGSPVLSFVAAGQDMEAMSRVASEAAEKMGGLDIVAPNVGKNWVAPLEAMDLDGWQQALDINLTASYIAVKVALPWLLQAQRADIVLIGSSAVVDGGGGGAHYAAAKAGLDGMMRALMRELPRQGIRINVVHPCVVDTDLLRERYNTEEKRAQLAAQVPVGRLATAEDIGSLVAYLCSELGGFICGQSILVDGGRTLWRSA